MNAFVGKWKLIAWENIDPILSVLSIPEEQKAALLSNVIFEIEFPEPNVIKIKSNLALLSNDVLLPINEDFEAVTQEGTRFGGFAERISDTKIMYTQRHPIFQVTATSEVVDDENTLIANFLGVRSTFKFRRI
ncbi:hypothetical protein FBUS_04512 [Fasciolopsis buskii]|uniref:Uncharacterized protein n=1 Tax=Fasciolopsis buskii TaxID=27845 RepID=A0A8E0RPN1_9TREM|nr:hypothetical protein FBUS_04512 [Fasciolopsis buski]